MKTALRNEAKQLRSDAKKLEVIAKHLRIRAKEIISGIRMEERAEAARTNFYSKESKIEPGTAVVPDMSKDPIFPEDHS